MTVVRFEEEMDGVTSDGRKLVFRMHVKAPKLASLLLARELELHGHADLERLATNQPLVGKLVVSIPWAKEMRYDVSFRGDDGACYRFVGKKDVRYSSPRETLTTLPGTLTKNGERFTDATVVFRWANLGALVTSVRLNRA